VGRSRDQRNPYRSDTKENVPEDPAERKEDQRSKAKVKGSKGEKRDFENNLKVTSRMGSETRR
jgi:hypothetical protein